ncbi:hypothetical protein [Brasilonema sp. UFV-L1]
MSLRVLCSPTLYLSVLGVMNENDKKAGEEKKSSPAPSVLPVP